MCIQEHWLYNFEKDNLKDASSRHTCSARSVDDDEPIPPYQRPRGYGGIATYIPSQWEALTRQTKDGNQRINVSTIEFPHTKLCIVNCYLPCRGYKTSYSDYDDSLSQLREIILKFSPSHEVIICGDLNATVCKSNPDSHDNLLDKLCMDMHLVIPPGSDSGPTFRHGDGRTSRIDFILVQQPNVHLISSVKYDDGVSASMNTSDHTALTTWIKCQRPSDVKTAPITNRRCRKVMWEKVKW